MTGATGGGGPPAVLPGTVAGGFALLERSMGWTLGSLQLVTPDRLDRPTPCARWDLRRLLAHMAESLRTLHDAIAVGHLELDTDPAADYGDPWVDPVGAIKARACSMMGAWAGFPGSTGSPVVTVGDAALPAAVVAATGAVEVAVHGWDVAVGCGSPRDLPVPLAADLLDLVPWLVDERDRPHRFGPRVEVPASAPPGDRLLGTLGRSPR